VKVDGDLHGVGWEERSRLFSKREGQGALGLPTDEMFEDPLAVPLGRASLRPSSGASDRGVTGSRPKHEVADPTEELRGELPPREAGGEERQEPGEGSAPHLSIREDARRMSPPVRRCLFPFGLVILLGRKPGSAASGVHTYASRGLGLEPRCSSGTRADVRLP
jgi:hypothetical protein